MAQARSPAGGSRCIQHLGARQADRRSDSEQDAGDGRSRQREQQDASIERCFGEARDAVRRKREQCEKQCRRQDQPGDSAGDAQHQAFGQRLPDQPSAAGAGFQKRRATWKDCGRSSPVRPPLLGASASEKPFKANWRAGGPWGETG